MNLPAIEITKESSGEVNYEVSDDNEYLVSEISSGRRRSSTGPQTPQVRLLNQVKHLLYTLL